MSDEDLEKKILELAKDSRISCKAALELAEQAGIPTQKMAGILNKHKIKVSSCQLGCF